MICHEKFKYNFVGGCVCVGGVVAPNFVDLALVFSDHLNPIVGFLFYMHLNELVMYILMDRRLRYVCAHILLVDPKP